MINFRIGNGYDVHRFAEGLDFWLGGIQIKHTKGCIAHSDGDVLIHAICDALLGALSLQDIGQHFPDTDSEYKGIDSKILLKKTVGIIRDKGYEVGNIDSIICLQQPKVKEYILPIKECLSNVMNISIDNISVKATTTEKLGFVGREEGVEAHAVVLLYKK